jgi:D-alanine-D-alanine ligase
MKVLVLHSEVAPNPVPEEDDTRVATEAVAGALRRKGFETLTAPFRQSELGDLLAHTAPDVVFNLVEGVDGLGALAPQAPRLLQELGLRFTGVGADAMALTGDKPGTKALLRTAGLQTPDWCVGPDWAGLGQGRYIVKSVLEDCSLGLDDGCVVAGCDVPARAALCATRLGGDWFAEQYVEGREFNIALLEEDGGPLIFPMAEMRFVCWPDGKPRIVGYDAKWEEGSSGWEGTVRAFGVERNEPVLATALRGACEQVWHLFGLRGFARVDFRVDQSGTPLILEINANPCITPDAGFAAAAAEAGMFYDDVIEALVRAA